LPPFIVRFKYRANPFAGEDLSRPGQLHGLWAPGASSCYLLPCRCGSGSGNRRGIVGWEVDASVQAFPPRR
jgi:hypothetical protein